MFSLCLTKYETTITQVYHKYFVVGGRHPPAIAEFWPKEPKTWRRPVSLKLNKGASYWRWRWCWFWTLDKSQGSGSRQQLCSFCSCDGRLTAIVEIETVSNLSAFRPEIILIAFGDNKTGPGMYWNILLNPMFCWVAAMFLHWETRYTAWWPDLPGAEECFSVQTNKSPSLVYKIYFDAGSIIQCNSDLMGDEAGFRLCTKHF